MVSCVPLCASQVASRLVEGHADVLCGGGVRAVCTVQLHVCCVRALLLCGGYVEGEGGGGNAWGQQQRYAAA